MREKPKLGALARSSVVCLVLTTPAGAQVPVIDQATLTQATTTASNTAQIMQTNQQILQTVNQTLQAVTGNRTTGSISSAALGSGFSMGGAPDMSSLLNGQLSWGSLGSFGSLAASFINGLNLVQKLSTALGSSNGSAAVSNNQSYLAAVNTASVMAGLVSAQQAAASTRTSNFQSAGSQIGAAADIKGSIDQNSQLQVQTGLTINELIGAQNGANAVLNAQQLQTLTAQSGTAQLMNYDATKATLQ